MNLLRYPASVIVVLAFMLTLPALLGEPMTHDSHWITWVWADQFTSELAQGNLYPRWLPRSHGGLGSPVFYYYSPLAFYLTGALGLTGLSTYASIIGAYSIGLAASGLAMYAWLKDRATSPLFGACFFMAAPYHIMNFYGRGALAESLAIALIPILALGLRRAVQGRIALCALAYAGLILMHLPLAILVSLFFAAPYAIYLSRNEPSRLLPICLSLLFGTVIAALYLIPAIILDPFRDTEQLWSLANLQPATWSLLDWTQTGPLRDAKVTLAAIVLLWLQPVALLIFSDQRRWGTFAAVCLAMAAALIPAIWYLPMLEIVQFPFRLLPLAEFAVATGIASIGPTKRLVAYATTVPLLFASAFFAMSKPPADSVMAQERMRQHPDVPENLPPGERPYSWPSQWALDLAAQYRSPRQVEGRTVEPVFYFPAWEVRCGGRIVQTAPDPQTQLLTYRGTECERRLKWTGAEWLGALLSLTGIVGLLGISIFRKRRQPGLQAA